MMTIGFVVLFTVCCEVNLMKSFQHLPALPESEESLLKVESEEEESTLSEMDKGQVRISVELICDSY